MTNFDRYDMIIGMPFMHIHKVILDFVNDTVHQVIGVMEQPLFSTSFHCLVLWTLL